MMKRFMLMILIALVPVQSWAVLSMGLQQETRAMGFYALDSKQITHSCHQAPSQLSDLLERVQPEPEDSACHSCTLCMAIGLIHSARPVALNSLFRQALHTVNQSLTGDDFSRLNKPPIV
jgi:Na+-transporting NADH:ubiquinone oxidoreductase subunit NqrB